MNIENSRPASGGLLRRGCGALYRLLARRAHTSIMIGALLCTLIVKFFHAHRMNLMDEYVLWILADVAVLLGIELVMSMICVARPTARVMRIVAFIAALVCTWSVMNAAWIIRNGCQLPISMLKPLFRDPVNTGLLIAGNLLNMPKAALSLLVPSAFALSIFFYYLAHPLDPRYNRQRFRVRAIISLAIVVTAGAVHATVGHSGRPNLLSSGMRYNSQLRVIRSLVMRDSAKLTRADYLQARRRLPTPDELNDIVDVNPNAELRNVVVIILEGVQHAYTSMDGRHGDNTPFMKELGSKGIDFTNMRSTLTHTTKAIFTLMTGRYPSVSHDIAETVPERNGFASLATTLSGKLGYRTAFFQSAKGNFEARPGLVHNLGFQSFWARDMLIDPNSLTDPNCFVGYLGCDEFKLIDPILKWVKGGSKPFLVTIMCSVTHDPYEVPHWFAEPASEQTERYAQTIRFTDSFIKELHARLSEVSPPGKTIFCVVGDHGEAFGEHGRQGHEMIPYDEALRIPWVMQATGLVEAGKRVTEPISSIDFTPTVMGLLGLETRWAGFDGLDVLTTRPGNRKIYFSGWIDESPAGFIRDNGKFIYNPGEHVVTVFDLVADPNERAGVTVPEKEAEPIVRDITSWCRDSVLKIDQKRNGYALLYGIWYCRWNDRATDVAFRDKPFGWHNPEPDNEPNRPAD